MHAAEAVSSPLSIVSLGDVGGDGGVTDRATRGACSAGSRIVFPGRRSSPPESRDPGGCAQQSQRYGMKDVCVSQCEGCTNEPYGYARVRTAERCVLPLNKKKERKQTTQRQGWEDGTPPPHRDFKERSVVLAVAHPNPWWSASFYLPSQSLADSRCNLHATSRSSRP